MRLSQRSLSAALLLAALAVLLAGAGCGSGTPQRADGHGRSSGMPANAQASPAGRSPSPGPPTGDTNPFLARVPAFPPPPPPQPIPIPAGPTAPIFKRLPINQPVAFLTMDDGWSQLAQAVPLMRAAHIPFTMFLIAPVAAHNPGFFTQLVAQGGVVEDHTITHPELKGKSYAFQHHEICDARESLQKTFGTTLTLFRPPFGDYDQTTLRVVHDCGLKAAFYWSETVNNGTVYYQTAVHRIAAGDIILMHFRPAFVNDVLAALTAIHSAGLTPALLENYFSSP